VRLGAQTLPLAKSLVTRLAKSQDASIDEIRSEPLGDCQKRLINGAVRVRDDEHGSAGTNELLADRADRVRLPGSGRAPDEGRVAAERARDGCNLTFVQLRCRPGEGFTRRWRLTEQARPSRVRAICERLYALNQRAQQMCEVALQRRARDVAADVLANAERDDNSFDRHDRRLERAPLPAGDDKIAR
jgi:hypothetical protein